MSSTSTGIQQESSSGPASSSTSTGIQQESPSGPASSSTSTRFAQLPNNANQKNTEFFYKIRQLILRPNELYLTGNEIFTDKDLGEISRLVSKYSKIPVYSSGQRGIVSTKPGFGNGPRQERRTNQIIVVNSSRDGKPNKTHLTIHFPQGNPKKNIEGKNIGPIHIRTTNDSKPRSEPPTFQARIYPEFKQFTVNINKIKEIPQPYKRFTKDPYEGISLENIYNIGKHNYNNSAEAKYDSWLGRLMAWAVEQVLNEKIRARLVVKEEVEVKPIYPIVPYCFSRPSPIKPEIKKENIASPQILSTGSSEEPCGGAGGPCISTGTKKTSGRTRRKNRRTVKTRKL